MSVASNFAAAAYQELGQNNNTYINSRYAPQGNQEVGMPFPLFRQPAYYFTQWGPSPDTESTWKKQFNLPTNTNLFRRAVEGDAINLGNQQLNAWVYRTQTLGNNGDTIFCTNNQDCSPWPGTTCNSNYENWPDAKGNQSGSFCSYTVYPELEGGGYHRKNANQGGIGKNCRTDQDCGEGYRCNNQYDIQGRSIQQAGYCSQMYTCPDGSQRYMGYPYNSGIPQPPPPHQNRNGQGYPTYDDCLDNALGQQNCVTGPGGAWFAVYPGYCPVPPSKREGGNPQGSIPSTQPQEAQMGFVIPAYATNMASKTGGEKVASFNTAWAQPQQIQDGTTGALQYSLSINPIPPNMV